MFHIFRGGLVAIGLAVFLASTSRCESKSAKSDAIKVTHLETRNGWQVAESVNFRIFHHQPRSKAEELAILAENARAAVQRKWFGKSVKDAVLKCEIYVHPTKAAYRKETKMPAYVAGHFSYSTEEGRVVAKMINLSLGKKDVIKSVLAHETTHVVLYERFGKTMPRWANEGMAVLSESKSSVQEMLKNLPKKRDDLFDVRYLMEMKEYPRARDLPIYYAQSVSLVDFLIHEKDPITFTKFLRDGRLRGFARAVEQHYGYQFPELERRWLRFTKKY